MIFRQGPKDDLECLGYSLLELWMGDLPWYLTTDESARDGWTPSALKKMGLERERIWSELVERGEIPDFLKAWRSYVTDLKPTEVPSYQVPLLRTMRPTFRSNPLAQGVILLINIKIRI